MTRRLLLQALGVIVGLALLFALVGFVEWATGRLLISNEKVLAANDLKPYFRVNSLFFDPNVYGRFLALVMVVLAGVLLWAPARRDVTRVAVALALLWAALVLTLSESSFAALLIGLAVLAALRWKPWPVVAVCGAIVVAACLFEGLTAAEENAAGWWCGRLWPANTDPPAAARAPDFFLDTGGCRDGFSWWKMRRHWLRWDGGAASFCKIFLAEARPVA